MDTCWLRAGGTFAAHTKSPAGCARSRAVLRDPVVNKKNFVVASYPHPAPLVGMDGVLNDVVRPAVSIDGGYTVSAVRIDQVVHDQCIRVAAGNGNSAIAFAAAIAEDSVALDVNRPIPVVPVHQLDRLAACARNREAPNGDKFRLLEAKGKTVGALVRCTGYDHASRRSERIGLDYDTVTLCHCRGVIFP